MKNGPVAWINFSSDPAQPEPDFRLLRSNLGRPISVILLSMPTVNRVLRFLIFEVSRL